MLNPLYFRWFVLSWMGIALVVFLILLRISVPYGRTARKGWGPLVSSRLGWIFMESGAALTFLIVFLLSFRGWNAMSLLFLFLWEFHYINRAFVFPVRMKSNRKRMAISIMMMALLFNLINGWMNGTFLFVIAAPYPATWFADVRFISGMVLFFGGWFINITSDELLLRQRKCSGGEYIIPESFLFRFISCPNYFGEVLEWLGWALLTWSLVGLSFFIWTSANLVPRALTYHRWYREHFSAYPAKRRALVPFVF